jgi:uncharacterized membrane protein
MDSADHQETSLADTTRLEVLSDGVFAIIISSAPNRIMIS